MAKAFVYAILDRRSGDATNNILINEQLLVAIRAILNEDDQLTIGEREQDFCISVQSTNESDVMKTARLVRNTFQQYVSPNEKTTMSIGVLLYKLPTEEQKSLVGTVKRLALQAKKESGNNIEFLDLTTHE